MPKTLAPTNDLSRQEWLELRKQGIGGSDAAAALGVSPYKTRLELYLEKRGEAEPEDLSENEKVRFGTLLEDTVAEEFCRRRDKSVHRRNAILQHPERDWMIANVDRKVEHEDALLECKTTNPYYFGTDEWGEEGTDNVPLQYLVQCLHYLEVTDYLKVYLAVLVGGQHLKIYEIEHQPDLQQTIAAKEAEFWNRVQSGNAPTPDYEHDRALDLMKRRYPGTSGAEITLPERAADLRDRYKELGEQKKEIKAERKAIKAELLDMVGDAAVGKIPGGGKVSRSEVERSGYTVDPTSYMQTRVS